MKTETMTVHKALSELKVLDARIEKKVNAFQSCALNRRANTKIAGIPVDDFKQQIVEEYQSLTDLMARRSAIKRVLSLNNAATKLMIAGKEYTLAEAIEAKRSEMLWKSNLLSRMQYQREQAQREADTNTKQLPAAADNYVSVLYSTKDKSVDSEVIAKAREEYIKSQTVELIDPLNLVKEMEKIKDEIDSFASDVDAAISVSNAITQITIEY